MNLEFFICGGELRIDKKVFIREMLSPASLMKQLLNYNLEDHGKTRSLEVDKTSAGTVVISFNCVDRVAVGEDYQKLLASLKKEYRGAVRGNVSLTAYYYNLMYINLDLNSDSGEIEISF